MDTETIKLLLGIISVILLGASIVMVLLSYIMGPPILFYNYLERKYNSGIYIFILITFLWIIGNAIITSLIYTIYFK